MRTMMHLLLMGMLVTPSFAGWRVTRVQSNSQGGTDTTVTLIQDQKLRMETSGEITLVDLNKEELTVLLPQQKSYWKGKARTFHQELNAMVEQMKDMMLQQLPKDRREEARKMMEQQKEARKKELAAIQASPTGKKETIAGVEAREYVLKHREQVIAHIWVGKHPLLKDLNMEKLSEMMQMEEGTSLSDAPAYRELIKKGLILKEVRGMMGQNYEEIIKIESFRAPASLFQIPEGYKAVSLQELMQRAAQQGMSSPQE